MAYRRAPEAIKIKMVELGISQRDIARTLNFSPCYINDFVRGRKPLNIAMAIRFAGLLNMSARAILVAQIDDELEGLAP